MAAAVSAAMSSRSLWKLVEEEEVRLQRRQPTVTMWRVTP
jgi:hypothetical protein